MKKKIVITSISVLALVGTFTAGVFASSDIKLLINGKSVAADVQIIDGSSYVPLRVVSESLGAEVKWDGEDRTISILQKGFNPATANLPPAKAFAVAVNVESGPMKMNITKVTMDPAYKEYSFSEPTKAIVLDVEVENTSNDKLSWYVTYGKIITNTKEQIDGKSGAERIGGDFIGKVKKTGQIVFPIKGDLNSITSFNYVITGPLGDSGRVGENKTTEIILK